MRPSDSQLKPCACGGKRQGNKSVCFPCWKSAPADLRAECKAARTIPEHRAALRQLVDFARSRNVQPSLF